MGILSKIWIQGVTMAVINHYSPKKNILKTHLVLHKILFRKSVN